MAQKQKATGIITLSAVSIKICCPLFCPLFKKYLLSIRNRVAHTHENVVTLHEIGTFRDHPYMVLEYVEGRTLREWLDERIMRLEEQ